MTAAFTAGYEAGKTEGYDKGFAEGVDWATPRIWNEAIEAAAKWHEGEAKELLRLSASGLASKEARNNAKQAASEHILYAAAIRKLKKP